MEHPVNVVSSGTGQLFRAAGGRQHGRQDLRLQSLGLHQGTFPNSADTLVCTSLPMPGCMSAHNSFVFPLLSFKAEESVDQLVYVCATDQEEVCNAAKQALLVLGNSINTHRLQ